MTAASEIGDALRRAMEFQGLSPKQLAERAGKDVRHLEAVIAGFPNTRQRPTELDTVDDIARALGLKLGLIAGD